MNDAMRNLGPLDLLVGLVIVLSVIGAVRRGAGLLSGVAAGAGAAVVCWLVAGAAVAWASPDVGRAVDDSVLLNVVAPPAQAISAATDLVTPGADGPGPR